MSTKVLVFESDPGFAGELRNELGKLGCATVVVDDGNVGLQQASADRPDLILLSIELPRMNGFSVCNKLKKDASLKDVPLIIMSSESSDETFEQHKKLRTRAEDYVHKPIAFGELLQHIQAFVALGNLQHESEAAIVIDDEIEIGSTDYLGDDDGGTQIAVRPPQLTPPPSVAPAPVDDDVDAFADAAFGRLTGDEPPRAVAEARPFHSTNNGASESVTSPAAPRRGSVVPAPRGSTVRPSRPPSGVDIAEYEKLRLELEAVRARSGDTETALGELRDEADKLRMEAAETDRLRREVEELKAKIAAGPKAGGISSREFLDLREALNKKDKEILSLREQHSKKDREIVEAQDRALALERGKADLEDKLLVLERELAETRDKADALAADKDLAKKASEDFKTRLEKARADGEGKDRQLADLRARSAEDAATAEAKIAAVRSELDQTLANERADQAKALDQAEERRRADLDQARRDRDGALAEAREAAERDQQDALAAQAAQLRQEHEGRLAALHRAHQQELEKARSEAAQAASAVDAAHDAALSTARRHGEEEAAAARAEAEQRGEAALAVLRAEHAEKVTSLENDRDSRVAALEAKAARELTDAHEKLAKVEMDLSATRGELSALREAKDTGDAAAAARYAALEASTAEKYAALEASTTARYTALEGSSSSKISELERALAETTSARDDFSSKLSAANDRIAALEADGASTRQQLEETRQKLANETSRADKAHAKWEADRQSLERAKDAMAVALAQIEEAEARSI
jgi:CheY-like chemotaxis protein